MKKTSNFYFNSDSNFIEEVKIALDTEECESLSNFVKQWFMVNHVDRLYVDFNNNKMTLNNQFERLNEIDAQVMQKYITERLGIDGAQTFDFLSYDEMVICSHSFFG